MEQIDQDNMRMYKPPERPKEWTVEDVHRHLILLGIAILSFGSVCEKLNCKYSHWNISILIRNPGLLTGNATGISTKI